MSRATIGGPPRPWTIGFEPVDAGPVEVTVSSVEFLGIDLDRSYTRLEVLSLIPRSGDLPRFMLDGSEEVLPDLVSTMSPEDTDPWS